MEKYKYNKYKKKYLLLKSGGGNLFKPRQITFIIKDGDDKNIAKIQHDLTEDDMKLKIREFFEGKHISSGFISENFFGKSQFISYFFNNVDGPTTNTQRGLNGSGFWPLHQYYYDIVLMYDRNDIYSYYHKLLGNAQLETIVRDETTEINLTLKKIEFEYEDITYDKTVFYNLPGVEQFLRYIHKENIDFSNNDVVKYLQKSNKKTQYTMSGDRIPVFKDTPHFEKIIKYFNPFYGYTKDIENITDFKKVLSETESENEKFKLSPEQISIRDDNISVHIVYMLDIYKGEDPYIKEFYKAIPKKLKKYSDVILKVLDKVKTLDGLDLENIICETIKENRPLYALIVFKVMSPEKNFQDSQSPLNDYLLENEFVRKAYEKKKERKLTYDYRCAWNFVRQFCNSSEISKMLFYCKKSRETPKDMMKVCNTWKIMEIYWPQNQSRYNQSQIHIRQST